MQFSEDILRAARELEISVRRNLTALLTGNYRSHFRGSGMHFKEFRHYEPGDDIRHMSWTATARTKKPILKVYEEERELDVVLMIDVSGSSLFGSGRKRRVDVYAELLALVGLAGIRSGDNIGMLLFTDKAELYLPPRRTREHVLSALTLLLSQPLREKPSDLRAPLLFAERVLKHRSLVLLLSDFLLPDFGAELGRLAKRHEVLLLHCYDEMEVGKGPGGLHEVWDPESGVFYLLDASAKVTIARLAGHQDKLRQSLENLSRNCRGDYLGLSLEEDYAKRLIRFFRRRGNPRRT